MKHEFPSPRHRPSWWPENEPWPPHGRMRRRFFGRMGCIFGLFNLVSLLVLTGLIVVILRGLGLLDFTFNPDRWLAPAAVGIFLLVVLFISLGRRGLRRVTVPLDELLRAADVVGQGDYSARVQEHGPREVRTLARAFNEMASRLHILDEQRRDLLADVTHELRTPLTIMRGNLEGMLDGVYPADESNLRGLLDETTILSGLVEDLRTLALAESGALQLRKEPTDLALLVQETAASFQAQTASAGVKMNIETQAGLPMLELDPGRFRQVLVNLLTNALHYTPPGGAVSIRCRQEGAQVILDVQDSGAGISPEDLPHVFDRFYRSTDSGGMGLGLAIARRLTEAHGGTITVQSSASSGTIMHVTLPIEE